MSAAGRLVESALVTSTQPVASPRDGADRPASLLDVRGLHTSFFTRDGEVKAVDGIDLRLERGRTLGLVGESGCGKSVTSLSLMRLLRAPGRIVGGEVLLDGTDLTKASEKQMRAVRGARISMIFQEPMTSLNPVLTCGFQIAEVIAEHQHLTGDTLKAKVIDTLRMVGIPQPDRRYDAYPHELSGGLRQRVVIAMALACDPDVLIADEPTTALDVTIQAQILALVKEQRERRGMALLLITHDLGVIAEMADDVAVMYAGQIVEHADVMSLFKSPKHPYTVGLLNSLPTVKTNRTQRLHAISGTVPNLLRLPSGCRFAPRCPRVMGICRDVPPLLQRIDDGRLVRCHLYGPAEQG
jgi:oligopeptide/dipeptide ABC transporter ATP-binding protein